MPNKQTNVRACSPGSHLLSLHKTVNVNGPFPMTLADSASVDLAHMAPSVKGLVGLDRAYEAFCSMVEETKVKLGEAPTESNARWDFTQELITHAWYCLAQEAGAGSQRQYAMVGLLVPDLLFARIDHLTPAAFAASLDTQTLENWHGIRRLLADRTMKIVLRMPAAVRIVMERLQAEVHLHRPMAEIFAEVADAR